MGRDHESRSDGEKGGKDPLQVPDMVLAALESWPRAWHGMILAATAALPTIFHVFQRGAAPGVWGWVTMKRPQEEPLPQPYGVLVPTPGPPKSVCGGHFHSGVEQVEALESQSCHSVPKISRICPLLSLPHLSKHRHLWPGPLPLLS